MKFKYTNKLTSISIGLIMGLSASTLAQANPLLEQNDNPLLQQNTSQESAFEQEARAIDLAATKAASDPVCQNIRANYSQEMAKIVEKSGSESGMSLSKINQFNGSSNSTTYRLARINRNLTGNSSGALGKVSSSIGRGTAVANDVAAIGGLLGMSGKKMSQKKALKKAAKLDAQAMDAVKQTGCPMATFQ